jgi:hypothetical protein
MENKHMFRTSEEYWKMQNEPITEEEDARMLAAYRTSGEMICEKCGKTYYRHPDWAPSAKTCGYPWLVEICNGDLVKL